MEQTTIMRNVKCVALLTTLLAIGCHHQHARPYIRVESDAWEIPDLEAAGPFVVSGSATPIDSTNFVEMFTFETNVDEMLTFLKSRGITPEIDDADHAKLYDSMKLRTAVAEYLGILNRRMDVIANNLANIHTYDFNSDPPMPYCSKVLLIHEDGSTSVEPNERPFPLEYSPQHPGAIKEGPNKGYVQQTNVDVIREQIDFMFTRRVYRLARDLLIALYDGPRCECCSQVTSTPAEPS